MGLIGGIGGGFGFGIVVVACTTWAQTGLLVSTYPTIRVQGSNFHMILGCDLV